MKLVNPLGRNVSGEAYTGNGAEPAACMCSGSSSYARARGTDKCFKCAHLLHIPQEIQRQHFGPSGNPDILNKSIEIY